MKKIVLLLILTLPQATLAQEISADELTKLYLIALEDFESTPLKIHKKDSRILVDNPDCNERTLPQIVGKSSVQWFCFEDDLTKVLEGNIDKHNGRSVILSSHRQPDPDTIKVRVDQWTIGNIGRGTSFIPINEEKYPEYKKKNHGYLFVKIDNEWELKEKANRLKPITDKAKEIEAIFQKGNSLSRQGNYKEALEHVERSMAMDSSLYQRYLFRSDLKVKLGLLESAISDVTKCIQRCDHKKTGNAHVSYYYLRRADIHEQNKDFISALKDINSSINSNPENWKAYTRRALYSAKAGEFEAALTDLNTAIKLDDNQAESYIARGMLNAQLGNTENACSDFKVVINWGYDEPKKWVKENCR